ncbi:MAG: TatD family hydrolase [Campylobacterota bacterium]|nr:TatD family hydrolase [Campylobacterota bacterium]
MAIIDTHCHLDHIQYKDDIEEVIKTALDDGIESFLIPGANPKDLPKAVELSEKFDEVFFAVGVHPYDIENYNLETLEQYVNHPKCIAIGECGLDYYRLPENDIEKEKNIKLQKEVFISQINFAKKVKKPLIIHIRDASNDSKKILIDHNAKEVGGVLHCFNASEHLLELADHNFYFGIGGVVTFKNAKKLVEILPKIPEHKIIVETDGPYLTPHPFRGTRNEPKYTNNVVEKIAEILSKTKEDIENLTTNNAKKLFKEFNSKN